MDKLKIVLQQLKKYHFWMLCLVVMVVGFYAWYSSAASLDQEKVANISEISQHKADVEAVANMPEHPNEKVLEGIDAQIKTLQSEVLQVWSDLYQRQRKEVLFWPPELTEGFIHYIDSKKFGDPIPVDLLEQYQDTITERLKHLRKIIGAKPSLEFQDDQLLPAATPGAPGPATKRKIDEPYIVVWDNEGDIRKIIDWEETPSALKVWVAQEDLWVYEQMLNIIKETNKRAKGPHDASVTRIYSIEAGASAAQNSKGNNRIYVDKSAGGDEASDAQEEPRAAPSEELGKEEIELLDSRYVDGEGKPIRAGQQPDVKEYKRIPVRFDLRMDQREISQLIVNCSNAALPIEVRQVRINPSGRSGRRTVVESGAKDDLNDAVGRQEAMVRVEIHGIIYLFNPPDLTRLEIEPTSPEQASQEPTGEPVDQAAPEATEPAVPPAATAEPTDPAAAKQPETPAETPEEAPAEQPTEDPVPKVEQAPADPAGAVDPKADVPPEKDVTPEGS